MPFLSTFSTISVRGFRGVGKLIPVVTHVDSDFSTSDLTTYSFAGKNIGSGKRIVVVLFSNTNATAGRTVSSASVDSVAGSLISDGVKHAQLTGGSGNNASMELWKFHLTAANGSTGTVAVTWSAGTFRCAVDIWVVTGVNDVSIVDVATNAATGSGARSLNVNTVKGGFVIGGATGNNSPSFTWSGLSERTDRIQETVGASAADVSNLPAAETPRSISVTFSAASTYSASMAVSLR